MWYYMWNTCPTTKDQSTSGLRHAKIKVICKTLIRRLDLPVLYSSRG